MMLKYAYYIIDQYGCRYDLPSTNKQNIQRQIKRLNKRCIQTRMIYSMSTMDLTPANVHFIMSLPESQIK